MMRVPFNHCRDKPQHNLEFTSSVLESCRHLRAFQKERKPVVVDGRSLDLSSVFAVACHGSIAKITNDQHVLHRMQRSVDLLQQRLASGEVAYGVNTGFGGSADTRTGDYSGLQMALVQHHNTAVLLPKDEGLESSLCQQNLASHSMPPSIVKAAMLIRCNSLLRGHSAVRVEAVKNILMLLDNGMVPVVPLRGSISASGDLTPLAYIAGALEGNPDISIRRECDNQLLSADKALKEVGLAPLDFGPKEGLGLLNGTAFSCGAASLVLYEANQLVLLSQVLTAMGTEALLGSRNNYHPFIANARPHNGQKEAAANIFRFLTDSKLAYTALPGCGDNSGDGLAQDRYALRTASQWIGPQIENMALSLKQVECEINSTTDNPLLDPMGGEIHHGGNFQAASITTAMEKSMTVMQTLGKMVFSQCSEIINPTTSRGLPPNLSVDDPSLSFSFKGVDVNMASYMSELAYLCHPVSPYVQSAEMHNQSLNSLALIGARYASSTVEILSLMTATYLYVLCQALDLRAMQREYIKDAQKKHHSITARIFSTVIGERLPQIQESLWEQIMGHWERTSTSDLAARSETVANCSVGRLHDLLSMEVHSSVNTSKMVQQWKSETRDMMKESYATTRDQFVRSPTTEGYLCRSSQIFYEFVRSKLAIPMHRGIIDHPTYDSGEGLEKECIGSHISKVYVALRQGEMREALLSCWEV